ncbi:sigma-54-dependent Fis family transcriptional regulator [Agromyces atrinae]|uniref:Fis family transcriptional regulator n=1 Tax=Agromyces atrinae TaxID=592376 RepID=A0A4Q2MCH2_9MICO|nr:helix-turn-helix domain-containing protein [Agromyces atrinae]NYD68111.1 transcriptional regulator of acetoin/glycerol metabolism [Agromyces atrinae]RXZ87742.1 Fis family transcriptional regulator [Agromyces atrinae]
MGSSLPAARIEDVKADFLAAASHANVRPDLLDSWRRSHDAIGVPENVRDVSHVDEAVLDHHLLDMFHAPLTRVSDDLDGTGLGLLLADAQGRILQRWSHDRAALAHLDRLGTVRGAVLAENLVGTNGVGTVAATGESVQISGAEHFADFYRGAVCTGSPVRHPLTGKLLAVVTISSDLSERSGLLRPLTHSVAMQLEQQVLDVERPSSRIMLGAFLEASQSHTGPVVAFGPQGLVMQSQRASRLTPTDLALLRQVCVEQVGDGRLSIELANGTVEATITPLRHGAGAVVALDRERRTTTTSIGPARPQLAGRASTWLAAAHQISRHRELRHPLVIAGEAGTGKTSLALGLPFRPGSTVRTALVTDAAERHISGSRKWLQRLAERIAASAPVVIRGIETLDTPTLAGVRSLVESTPGRGAVLLTMSTTSAADAEALGGRIGMPTLWVPPLRERSADIPLLWQTFAETLAPGAALELTPEASEIVRTYRWPGNVTELRGVIEQLVISGKRGAVHPGDLPAALRGTRMLSMIERAELEAIQRALQEAHGNRSKAAEILGLSRATVYRKMKAYRLTA